MEPLPDSPLRLSTQRSDALMARASLLFSGGVSHPSRALRPLGEAPRVMVRAEGAVIYDADQHRYLDFAMAGGPIILGHAAPRVNEAITRAVLRGATFNASCEDEILLGERVIRWIPSIEKLRFTASETEALSAAVRLARAWTGREGVARMEGHHHGEGEIVHRMATGLSADGFSREPWFLPWNDFDAARIFFQRCAGKLAALILEPVSSSMGVVPPKTGYLRLLRELTREAGSVLIFDETVTGFRLGRGGAQEFYGVHADLTVLGKILGGGLPVGAVGGRHEILNLLSPLGPVAQAGIFAGNPPAMAAGLAVMDALEDETAYADLEARGARLESALVRAGIESGIPLVVQRVGSMMSLFFAQQPVENWSDFQRSDARRWAAFSRALLAAGVYLPHIPEEAMFVSLAHSAADLDRAGALAAEALMGMRIS